MNPINIPVVAQFHLNQIHDRNNGNFDAVHGKVFRPERWIRHHLTGPDLFTAEDEMNGVPALRFAGWKKHVYASRMAEREAMMPCYLLNALDRKSVV